MENSFNALYFLALGHQTCLTVFIRSRFGWESLTWATLAAVLVQLAWGLIAPDEAFMGFFGLWWIALIFRGMTRSRRNHSKYSGYPWLTGIFASERIAGGLLDPLLCVVVGILLTDVSESLGVFVMLGAVSMTFCRITEALMVNRRRRRMQDVRIEMQDFQ